MGLTIEEGMTTTDPAEAFTKETVMRQAREVILLVHSEKIGKVSFSRSGKIKQITRIITDSRVDESFVKQIQKLNIDLTKAS
jgi:DeoR family fructose operon transcriptional repressor